MLDNKCTNLWPDPCSDPCSEYYFQQMIQGINITFPVDFDKENGVWKLEGKEYIVEDGDIISVRHS